MSDESRLAALEARLQNLEDRQAIRDCVVRLARGDDRLDRELFLTVFHPDGTDDHKGFNGTPEEFFDWIYDTHKRFHKTTLHHLTNQSCDIDGDTAHTETYWIFSGSNVDGKNSISWGRYLDRLERRDGHWKIAFRYAIIEAMCLVEGAPLPFANAPDPYASGLPSQTRSDPSYLRPLLNRRARLVPAPGSDYE